MTNTIIYEAICALINEKTTLFYYLINYHTIFNMIFFAPSDAHVTTYRTETAVVLLNIIYSHSKRGGVR